MAEHLLVKRVADVRRHDGKHGRSTFERLAERVRRLDARRQLDAGHEERVFAPGADAPNDFLFVGPEPHVVTEIGERQRKSRAPVAGADDGDFFHKGSGVRCQLHPNNQAPEATDAPTTDFRLLARDFRLLTSDF